MSDTWLSQDAHDRLRAELEELRTGGRARTAKALEIARAHGDIRENAEYDSAKDEQGKLEARIRQLEQLLRDAKVGTPDGVAGSAGPGTVVTVVIDGDEETYLLVSSREERHPDYDVLSTASPLGSVLLGAKAGDVVKANAPSGDYKVKVKGVRAP